MQHSKNKPDKKKKAESSSSQSNVARFKEACPKNFAELPVGVCKFGLERARWTADNPNYLAYEEKHEARGCPFGLLTEDKYGYCLFKLMANVDRALTEDEMVRMLMLSKEQINKITSTAFYKLKDNPLIAELQKLHADGGLFKDNEVEDDIYFHEEFQAEAVSAEGTIEDLTDSLKNSGK